MRIIFKICRAGEWAEAERLGTFRGSPVDLRDGVTFYYLVLAVLALCLLLGHRLVNARFGLVVRAAKSNEARARSVGSYRTHLNRSRSRRSMGPSIGPRREPDSWTSTGLVIDVL